MKKLIIIISAILASAGFIYFSLLIYIDKNAEQDTKIKSDAILVLGGSAIGGISCVGPICKNGFVPNPHYNPCLVARVMHGVSLYKDHYAPKIVMTGGNDEESNVNEAETMKKIATEAGVPEKDILLEKESTSTHENFLLSKKILEEAGLLSIIVVTDPYHSVRAGLIASKLHYQYSLSPAVESACWDQDKNKPFTNRDSRREVFALIVYKLLNKI